MEGTDYRIAAEPATHLEFVDFSRSAQTETRYIMELFTVRLGKAARRKVEADAANRWLSDAEIQSQRTGDAQVVSPTMRRVLGVANS